LEANGRVGLLAWRAPRVDWRYERVEVLSQTGDLREAAATLFAKIRRLDDAHLQLIIRGAGPRNTVSGLQSWIVCGKRRRMAEAPRKSARKRREWSAAAVMCSRLLGLIRDQILNGLFGAGPRAGRIFDGVSYAESLARFVCGRRVVDRRSLPRFRKGSPRTETLPDGGWPARWPR
jgi:hypothetical protein